MKSIYEGERSREPVPVIFREQVTKLAEYFHQDENEMLTLWLADKVLDAVDGEQELSSQAIEVAQEQIKEL